MNPPTVRAGRLSAVWNRKPKPGNWWLNEHGTSNDSGVKQRFVSHAWAGARLLGFRGSRDKALAFWLNRVRLSLRNAQHGYLSTMHGGRGHKQRQEFVLTEESIEILDICLMSADYCLICRSEATVADAKSEPVTPEAGDPLIRNSKRESPPTTVNPEANAVEPAPNRNTRLNSTVTSEFAARRMEAYLRSTGIGQTEFATKVNTTDRTLRNFRKTGRVRRDIFDAIATAMGTTRQALIDPEKPAQ